jgi:hypothetical protein
MMQISWNTQNRDQIVIKLSRRGTLTAWPRSDAGILRGAEQQRSELPLPGTLQLARHATAAVLRNIYQALSGRSLSGEMVDNTGANHAANDNDDFGFCRY